MHFFFLRHTSLNVEPNIFYGQTDLDVSDSFRDELKIIKNKIKKENININKMNLY